MGIARSTFYDRPDTGADDATVVAQMKSICDEFETYGYRRVDAELRHRGLVVNAKKVRRLMREHALNPQPRRRFIATTDSDHNDPICPNLAKIMTLDGPNQLWVADITYVAITTSFVYVAVTLDAWSRRVVGYAISRSIDARLAAAALKAAISARNPPRGCVHHSDRGSQYASETYRHSMCVLRQNRWCRTRALERPGAEADQCCGLVRNEFLTQNRCHSTRPQRSDPGSTRPVLPARYWFSSAKLWLARRRGGRPGRRRSDPPR